MAWGPKMIEILTENMNLPLQARSETISPGTPYRLWPHSPLEIRTKVSSLSSSSIMTRCEIKDHGKLQVGILSRVALCLCHSLITQIRSHLGMSCFLSQYLSAACFRKRCQQSFNTCSHDRRNRTWKTITMPVSCVKPGVCLALPGTPVIIMSHLHNLGY